MRISSITRLAPWASPVLSFMTTNHPRHQHSTDFVDHPMKPPRRFTGLRASTLPETREIGSSSAATKQEADVPVAGSTSGDKKSTLFFANRQQEPSSPPPEIPPPHFFDDPVDLSVVVSWVEDVFSEKWGTLEDIQPLFYEFGMGYTQVAICVSESQKNIYVTFRGTDIWEFPDVLANLNILWDSYGPVDKEFDPQIQLPGKVQRGWNRKIFNPRLYIPLSEELLMAKKKYPEYQVIVAGHSLGAALSILYGTYVAKYVLPDEPVQVINLGSPRVGDEEFYHAIQEIPNLTIWRMVFRDDIVPRCPPMVLGYRHVGHMLHWDSDDTVSGKVKAYHQQLETCTTIFSPNDDDQQGKTQQSTQQCYAGIDPKDWNILFGKVGHHEHKNYKCIVEQSKEKPHKYWPDGFELLNTNEQNQST